MLIIFTPSGMERFFEQCRVDGGDLTRRPPQIRT
jgi:hypothetical protein